MHVRVVDFHIGLADLLFLSLLIFAQAQAGGDGKQVCSGVWWCVEVV